MLKVALIGCGGMGSNHARSWITLEKMGKVSFVAVADLNEGVTKGKVDEILSLCNAKYYKNGDELLDNEKPDVVDVCLPTFLHTKYAVRAMEMGCHVFIEKPVCLNEEQAIQLLETQKRTGAKVQVGQVLRFWDEYMYLKKVTEEKTFGEIISGNFRRLSPNPRWGWEDWYNKADLSGTMALDLHVHDVDFIRYLNGGDPDSVSSTCARAKDGTIEQIFSIYKYGEKSFASEGCWDFPNKFPFTGYYLVKFENATVELNGTLTVYPVGGEPFTPELEKLDIEESDNGLNVSNDSAHIRQKLYFLDNVITGKGPEIAPLCDAVGSARLAWKEVALCGGVKK